MIAFDADACSGFIDETCGAVVEKDDVSALIEAIEKEAREHNFTAEGCVKRVSQFTQEKMVNEYLALYSEILSQKLEVRDLETDSCGDK